MCAAFNAQFETAASPERSLNEIGRFPVQGGAEIQIRALCVDCPCGSGQNVPCIIIFHLLIYATEFSCAMRLDIRVEAVPIFLMKLICQCTAFKYHSLLLPTF